MESKIEKIELVNHDLIVDFDRIEGKINEIIDYLNTQPQAEENEPDKVYVDPIEIDFVKEPTIPVVFKTREEVMRQCKSTPEQKEDKKLYIAVEDILSDYHIGVFTDAFYITKLVELFKNLLSEREMFTKEELFMLKLAINDIHNKGNSAYDEIGEKIKRELSKLNKKK